MLGGSKMPFNLSTTALLEQELLQESLSQLIVIGPLLFSGSGILSPMHSMLSPPGIMPLISFLPLP